MHIEGWRQLQVRVARALSVAACVCMIAGACVGETKGSTEEEVAGASAARLTSAQLAEDRHRALSGDGHAAIRVHMHYAMSELDQQEAENWARIAAENDHVFGIIEYGGYLLARSTSEACFRARFWAERANRLANTEDERSESRHYAEQVRLGCEKRLQE
jgi:hypothetical protein